MSVSSLFKPDAPRKSTDSWNSSTQDGGDDESDWDWTPEQIALLGRTLDAIPSHLLTPFNGPVPPANILDKIARSIINAKDPLEWPHSVRATRIRLLKLARTRADEALMRDDASHDVLQATTNVPPKKPLYRQSSMDFLKGNILKDEKSMDRLSARLQRAERAVPNPKRNPLGDDPYTPTTPTEDQLAHRNSSASLAVAAANARGPRLRRSTTTISNLPTIPSGVATSSASTGLPAPYSSRTLPIPKIKRSESFSSPFMNGLGHTLKRAPSFGTVSTRSHDSSRMSVDDQKENTPSSLKFESPVAREIDIYPSSDEEEKARNKKVKKQRIAPASTADKPKKPTSSSSILTVPKASSSSSSKTKTGTTTPTGSVRVKKAHKEKQLKRASSMFGSELPHVEMAEPTPLAPPLPSFTLTEAAGMAAEPMPMPVQSPHKTLRRVKTTNFPRAMSRRISFGSLVAPVEEEVEATGLGLGSAFQMQ